MGIKVLTLFFVHQVSDYREYDAEGKPFNLLRDEKVVPLSGATGIRTPNSTMPWSRDPISLWPRNRLQNSSRVNVSVKTRQPQRRTPELLWEASLA